MNLTKFQVNAVKSMARGLAPLQRKLERIGEKRAEFLSNISLEEDAIQKQIDQIHSGIIAYTGGFTLNEVLNPASTINETVEGTVDGNAQVDMIEIIPEQEVVEEQKIISQVEETVPQSDVPFWEEVK